MVDDQDVLFRETVSPSLKRVPVIFIRKWIGTREEIQERKNTEVLLGHLDYRDGEWCADEELVEKLQERWTPHNQYAT